MNDLLHDEYDRLPESIKRTYSFSDYLWMDNEQRRTLIQSETEPEVV